MIQIIYKNKAIAFNEDKYLKVIHSKYNCHTKPSLTQTFLVLFFW